LPVSDPIFYDVKRNLSIIRLLLTRFPPKGQALITTLFATNKTNEGLVINKTNTRTNKKILIIKLQDNNNIDTLLIKIIEIKIKIKIQYNKKEKINKKVLIIIE